MPESPDHPDVRDPLASMRIERIVREDGRSLIYYDWPDDAPSLPGHGDGAAPDEEPDV